MVLPAATRLDPYEIQSAVGAGGMGEVYKARDTRLERIVATKVLPDTLATDPGFRERFDREAKAVAALTHPHICAIYDVGHQDRTAYLVMEYLEGITLAGRLGHRTGANCFSSGETAASWSSTTRHAVTPFPLASPGSGPGSKSF
jgi:serine/threonine protein kinase